MTRASALRAASIGVAIAAWAIAASGCGGGRGECPQTPARASVASGPLADYGWLAGTWVADGDDGTRTEETWTLPRGTIMPGTSHTEDAAGATQFWESLRIERHGDLVQYVAHPMGAVELQPGLAVFENGQHDYPQRITYALESPTMLRATVSDLQGASPRSWLLRREAR